MNKDRLCEDLFKAYFDARKNKRNKIASLHFEKNFETKIFELFEEIVHRRYKPKPSVCFTVEKPVRREIFAADFSDRVVHHFIYNYISPIFEKTFINDTYSCRKGKGVHYGVARLEKFIRSCSENYQKDCYILKLDIKAYFMSMRKDILFRSIENVLKREGNVSFDLDLIVYLIERTIFEKVQENCVMKKYEKLPFGKSLFDVNANCGLPIGNLTSQLFGNVYLNEFDHYIKKDLGIRYYGRYVDDFVIVHRDKEYLRSLIPKIREYLDKNLSLCLHPDKIYLQHFSKGVKYLGFFVKPYRKYILNSTKGNLWKYTHEKNHEERVLNSYLGMFSHGSSYNLLSKFFKQDLII